LDFFEFRKSFESELARLKLPGDCKQLEPTWEVILPPLSWSVTLILQFSNDKYVRVWENHDRFAGLQDSRRIQWAYHYGDVVATNTQGDPVVKSPDDPLEIRIDTCSGLHMHYRARNPHYEQKNVVGLDLKSINSFNFIKRILKHRKTATPLDKVFGFKLI